MMEIVNLVTTEASFCFSTCKLPFTGALNTFMQIQETFTTNQVFQIIFVTLIFKTLKSLLYCSMVPEKRGSELSAAGIF